MRRLLACALVLALGASSMSAQADPFAPLRFLLGDWRAVDSPPGETGSFSFRPDVQNHVIVRTNQAIYAATAERPASRHEDLLVIYAEGGAVKADYFDSEGHVIRYVVESDASNSVRFVSLVVQGEPRYRLSYRAGADGRVIGSFEVAPPGSPDGFKPYLSWTAARN
jgi:hypothetical protein